MMILKMMKIAEWQVRAHATNFCVKALGKNCGVSARTLDRYFKGKFGLCPQVWLKCERMRRAMAMVMDGFSLKETAFEVGYKHMHHFSRDFKKHFGYGMTQVALPSAIPPDLLE